MNRKQFTFYKSFCDGIARIKNKAARCDAYEAIINYALNGVEPDLDKMPDAAATAFILARPVLEASRKKAEAGSRGNPKTNDKDIETNRKDIETKPKDAEVNRKQEKEQVKEQEQMLKESTKEKRTVFKAPTVEAVAAYIREKGYPIDAQHFVDYYQRQGWKLSNGQPMKDWQSAVRLWSRDKKPKKNSPEYFGKGPIDAAATRANYERLLAEEESA